MERLPIFLDLHGQPVLVVGGGSVAARKIDLLLQAGAYPRVVAPEVGAEVREWRDLGVLEWRPRRFQPADLDQVRLVFAATGDREVNQAVYAAAEAVRIPVNSVDDKAHCRFIMPAVVDRSPLQIAVTTNGASPLLAGLIRQRLERWLPHYLAPLAALAGRWRAQVKTAFVDLAGRRAFWQQLLDSPRARQLGDAAPAEADRLMSDWLAREDGLKTAPDQGHVALVGAGPGRAELITLRGAQLLQDADVVLYDHLVGAEVLDYARRDARRIFVGKQAGRHYLSQPQINTLLLHHAGAGRRVVRLKGGDPFVFGRGGEEVQTLRAAGIDFEIVPGVTAAMACGAYAGIPLTHRDHAQAVTLVTGHACNPEQRPDWTRLAHRETLVVYMGVAQAADIQSALLEQGRAAETPVAIVENGTLPQQKVHRGQLRELASMIELHEIRSPAVIVIGEVAALADDLAWFGADHSVESVSAAA